MRRVSSKASTSALWMSIILFLLAIVGFRADSSVEESSRPDVLGYGLQWNHDFHARMNDFTCQDCHHMSKRGSIEMQRCNECHPTSPDLGQKQPPPSKAGIIRTAFHNNCAGCHKSAKAGPTECAGCHDHPEHGAGGANRRCGQCHEDVVKVLAEGNHISVACASCHTNLSHKIVDEKHPRPVPRAKSSSQCLRCHGSEDQDKAGFPSKRFENCPGGVKGNRRCFMCHPDQHHPRREIYIINVNDL